MSRAYQALYGVGLILGAYVAGVAVGGDGFLAAFAAGMATVVLNYDLCDCFLEYGEVTAEMAMLLAFILFGAVLSSLLDTVALGPALVLAALALGVARPLALTLILWRATMSRGGASLYRLVRSPWPEFTVVGAPGGAERGTGRRVAPGGHGRCRHRLGRLAWRLGYALLCLVWSCRGAGDAPRGARRQRCGTSA